MHRFEVVLDLVEVAVVVVGDLLRGSKSPLRMRSTYSAAYFLTADDGVERVVDALDHLAEVALDTCRRRRWRRRCRRRSCASRHARHVGDQGVDGVDALVQVVLDLVEVAVVVVGDLGGDVALGDPVDVLGGHVQRADDRVERVVDAVDDRAELGADQLGVAAGLQAGRPPRPR